MDKTFGGEWVAQLRHVIEVGKLESSRAGDVLVSRQARTMEIEVPEDVREQIQYIVVDNYHNPKAHGNFVTQLFPKLRAINTNFAVADAKTVIQGLDDISLIQEHAPKYGELYTKDGFHLPDSYGPPYVKQRDSIVKELQTNPDSRRAACNIYLHPDSDYWDELNIHQNVGVPCTLAWQFQISGDVFHMHSFMRSSDSWVGLPNDMFVVACVAEDIVQRVGLDINKVLLHITAANSHIYLKHAEKVLRVLGTTGE